jgi:hypothetical protein
MAHLTRIETMMLMCNLSSSSIRLCDGILFEKCLQNAHMKDWNSIENNTVTAKEIPIYSCFFFIHANVKYMKSKTIFINKTKIASTDGL